MNNFILNIGITISFLLFLYRISKGYVTYYECKNKLIKHLVNKGNSQIEIHKLNVTEKLKYGVPTIWFFGQFYRLEPLILSLKYVDSFKIEYKDPKDREWTKYVEITFKNKGIISYSEFDSFEI